MSADAQDLDPVGRRPAPTATGRSAEDLGWGLGAGHDAVTGPDPTRLPRLLAVAGREGLDDHWARLGPLPPRGTRRGGAGGSALVDVVEASGLLGRGGAAFPTGRKLRATAEASLAIGNAPLVVVNAMEGEPASAKDRVLVQRSPHLVLDGATAAAEALGADEIVICVPRTDHTLSWAHEPRLHGERGDDRGIATEAAAHSLHRAVDERRRAGAERMAITVARPPDSYVAGEASALVRWLGGGPALPAFRVVRSAQSGVSGAPTLLDNAETFAHIGLIARFGAPWFRALGTPHDPGSALVTVSGAVAHPGVAEIPLGATVGDVLAAAGGATEEIQAFLLGGYGGRWLRADEAMDLPLGHSPVRVGGPRSGSPTPRTGAGLGPGIVVALPARACGLAETARVTNYLAGEGARQCGPCAYGLPALASALDVMAWPTTAGAVSGASTRLVRWTGQIEGRGACGHPDGVVRLVKSALRTFASDLERHHRGAPCEHIGRPPVLPIPSVAPRPGDDG